MMECLYCNKLNLGYFCKTNEEDLQSDQEREWEKRRKEERIKSERERCENSLASCSS